MEKKLPEVFTNEHLLDIGPQSVRVYGSAKDPLFHSSDLGEFLRLKRIGKFFEKSNSNQFDIQYDFIKHKIKGSSMPVNLLTNQGLIRVITGLRNKNLSLVYEHIANSTSGLECLNLLEIGGKTHGHVYFIGDRSHEDMFKIGYTTTPVNSRLSSLQTGNPNELYVYANVSCDNPRTFEQYLHDCFSEKHIRGEWYSVTSEEIKKLVAFLG